MRKVEVNVPGSPEGEPVEVMHLGLFPNKQDSEVTDEQADWFFKMTGLDFPADKVMHVGPKTDTDAVLPVDAVEDMPAEVDADAKRGRAK
jgi:hypothetical protein